MDENRKEIKFNFYIDKIVNNRGKKSLFPAMEVKHFSILFGRNKKRSGVFMKKKQRLPLQELQGFQTDNFFNRANALTGESTFLFVSQSVSAEA